MCTIFFNKLYFILKPLFFLQLLILTSTDGLQLDMLLRLTFFFLYDGAKVIHIQYKLCLNFFFFG